MQTLAPDPQPAPASRRLLGVKLTPTTTEELFTIIARAIASRDQAVIASLNLHGLYVLSRDATFRSLHEDPATCVHIDGMSVVWLGRLCGLPLSQRHRTAWIDWFPPLLAKAENEGWRVFYLGGTPEVVDVGLARLRARFPALCIAGRDGYFDHRRDSPDNRGLIAEINRFRPDLLIVGMGMGRQERWIVENRAELEVGCIGTCGACLEYFAGAMPTPPRWLGGIGLEWAFRLLCDPRRFWKRYLVEPWFVAAYLAGAALGRGPGRGPMGPPAPPGGSPSRRLRRPIGPPAQSVPRPRE